MKVAQEYSSAEKTLKKLYLDISAKPYILCPRCQTPLHVDMKQKKPAAAAAPAAGTTPAPAASASGGAAAAADVKSSAGGEAVGGKASAGQSAPNANAVPENGEWAGGRGQREKSERTATKFSFVFLSFRRRGSGMHKVW